MALAKVFVSAQPPIPKTCQGTTSVVPIKPCRRRFLAAAGRPRSSEGGAADSLPHSTSVPCIARIVLALPPKTSDTKNKESSVRSPASQARTELFHWRRLRPLRTLFETIDPRPPKPRRIIPAHNSAVAPPPTPPAAP
jgi:hypothetical protein